MTIRQIKLFDAMLKKINFPGMLLNLTDGLPAAINTTAKQTVSPAAGIFSTARAPDGLTLAAALKKSDVFEGILSGTDGEKEIQVKCSAIKISAGFALVFFMSYNSGSPGELTRIAGTEDIFPRAFIKDKQLNFKCYTQNLRNDFSDLGGSGYENYDVRFAGDYIVNELNIINTGRPAFSRCEFINTGAASNCVMVHRIPLLSSKNEVEGLLCVYPPALTRRDDKKRRKEQDAVEQNAREAGLLKDILYVLQENGDFEYALKYVVFALGERLKGARCAIYTYDEKTETFFYCAGYDSRTGAAPLPRSLSFPGTAGALVSGLTRSGSYISREGDIISAHMRNDETAAIIPLLPMQFFYGVLFFTASPPPNSQTLDFLKQIGAQLTNFITRSRMMEELKSEKKALENIVGKTSVMMMVAEFESYKILYANEPLCKAVPGVAGKRCHDVLYGRETPCPDCKAAACAERRFESFVTRLGKWFDIFITTVEWEDNRPAILIQLMDITESKLSRQRAEFLAYKDEVTSLPNRYSAENNINALFENSRPQSGHLLLIDMDNFKNINDAYGHDFGDKLLFNIASGLTACCGDNQITYRLGGDEFLIVLPGSDAADLDKILNKLTALSKKAYEIEGTVFYCTMSIGVVRFPEDGKNFVDLLRKADISLYKAKSAGKDSISFFMGREVDLMLQDQMELERLLRHTIEEDYHKFALHYQPLIDLNTGEIIGAEALIRLFDKKGGTIYPHKFIPLCEYNGLIQPLGRWILETGFCFCDSVNKSGFPDFKLHINMSVKQILQFDINDIVENILKKSGVSPGNIILEITETAAYTDFDYIHSALSGLKKSGIKLAIDDFGTGFSSMKALRNLPFDVIKIDITYISDIFNPDGNSATFINLITELGHKSKRAVCAEGVETAEQADYLKKHGIDYAQGYLFSKPVPPTILMDLLKK